MRKNRRWLTSLAAFSVVTVTPLTVSVATGTPTGLAASPNAARVTLHHVGSFRLAPGGASTGELKSPTEEDAAASLKAVANRSPNNHAKQNRGTPPPTGIVPTQTLGVNTPADSGWQGINHYDQRHADGGNQWSTTPPDQALCTNGTQVVESANVALAVYGTNGSTITAPISLNQLFWRDHEVDRSNGGLVASIHQLGDPDCVYDPGTDRYYLSVYDLVSDTAGNPTGPSYVDIAVSPVGSAEGTWTTYQLDTTNDGTHGTTQHPHCPCFADYPHIATDANALYVSTNEYSTIPFGTYFNGANVYALAKGPLGGTGGGDATGVMINTDRTDLYKGTLYPGSTLAPARATGTAYPSDGTMYFLSSDSWSGDQPVVSDQILVWRLTGAATLTTNPLGVHLTKTVIAGVNDYYPPPRSDQKAGTVPLADCLNLTSCAKAVLGTPDRYKEYEFPFDSGDTRMLQSAYADGLLWGALDTAVDLPAGGGGTVTKAGVAYYVVDPADNTLVTTDTLAVAGNNISYPALGVTAAGHAAMALTLVGPGYFPSAAFVSLDADPATPVSDVTVVGAGHSPDDDFSGYRGFLYNTPRWGDYGAANVVGNDVWLASEYIAQQPCSLSQFISTNFTCGGNQRTALANWSTHIAKVTP